MRRPTHTKIYALLIIAPVVGHFVPIFVDLPIWGLTPRRLAIFILFSFALYSLSTKDWKLHITLSDLGLLTVLSILVVSILWSPDLMESLRRGVTIIQMWMYYFSIIIYFRNDKSLDVLLRALLFAAILIVIYALGELFVTGELSRGLANYISRNRLSRNILALLPVVTVVCYLSTDWRRYLFGLIAFTMSVLVLLSGSRGGMVGLFVVVAGVSLVLLHFGVGLSPRISVPLGVVVIGITSIIVLITVQFDYLPPRLTNIPLSPEAVSPEVLGEKRYHVHQAEIQTIKEHWLIGVGYEGFVVLSEEVYRIGSFRAHNLITRVWMSAGFVPVLILIATGLCVFRNYIRAISSTHGTKRLYLSAFFIGVVGITTAGWPNIVIDEPLWYILLGVGSNWVPRNITYQSAPEKTTADIRSGN